MDAAVSALSGVAIGVVGSVVTTIVQVLIKDKRERSKQLIEMSIAQYKAVAEHPGAKDLPLLPLTTFLHHNDLVLKAIEDGSLTPEKLREINASGDQIEAMFQTPTQTEGPAAS